MKFLMTKAYKSVKYTIRCGILRCWWVEARSLCLVISTHLFESYYHNLSYRCGFKHEKEYEKYSRKYEGQIFTYISSYNSKNTPNTLEM